MAGHLRIRLLVFAAVAVIAGAVWLAGDRQRTASDRAFAEVEASQHMRDAMQDAENGLLGYANTGRAEYGRRYRRAHRKFESARLMALQGAPEGEGDEIEAITEQTEAARRWEELADEQVAAALAAGGKGGFKLTPALDAPMRRFRTANEEFHDDVVAERLELQDRAVVLTVLLIVLLGAAFGGLGFVGLERRARREHNRRSHHSRFTDVLQLARTESEAHGVVKNYIQLVVPGATATVLNRNNSANRLEATTAVDDPGLQESLVGVDPESCMAIRGGRVHHNGDSKDLMRCEVCGVVGSNVTCIPSLVGGEVIGSVLVEHPSKLKKDDADHVAGSISEAAPVLANMRNLAIAEFRAATDGLTGLPNSRSIRETLKLLLAQAGRTGSPLAAVMFDLDRFKQVNDGFGHEKGDELLAAVGDAVASTVRGHDVVGRYGGEEFLVLLPNTDRDGGAVVAENLRVAISKIEIAGLVAGPTASFGVAAYPEETLEPDELVRLADRALYRAKANRRNRVETLAETNGVLSPQ